MPVYQYPRTEVQSHFNPNATPFIATRAVNPRRQLVENARRAVEEVNRVATERRVAEEKAAAAAAEELRRTAAEELRLAEEKAAQEKVRTIFIDTERFTRQSLVEAEELLCAAITEMMTDPDVPATAFKSRARRNWYYHIRNDRLRSLIDEEATAHTLLMHQFGRESRAIENMMLDDYCRITSRGQ